MSLADILHVLGALAVLASGIAAVVRPASVAGLLALSADGEAGLSEVRAGFGGLFAGLAGFALWVQDDLVFAVLGAGFIGALLTRWIDIAAGRAGKRVWLGVLVETAIAVALLYPRS